MVYHDIRHESVWPDGPPRLAWHSFDATPWLHPWLTRTNLSAIREASAAWRNEAKSVVERADRPPNHFAFVGNIANGMYLRAKAVTRAGVHLEVFGLYGDDFVMSDARWEEYDGIPTDGNLSSAASSKFLEGIKTAVPFTRFTVSESAAAMRESDVPQYARVLDFRRWPDQFANIPAFDRLQHFDAVLANQLPFFAYLSGRPYAATSMGGDLWFVAARDDAYGRLQRAAYFNAGCVLVSNPWTLAHARRYGLTNLIYLPLIIDESDYSPGPPELREQWRAKIGGNFFVISTARADDQYKGSQIGLRGFAQFSRDFPGARLVVVAWGEDIERVKEAAAKLEIADRLLLIPVAGKRLLVKYLRSSDCLLDQFVVGYYGATALEGAACGLPVIMRYEAAQYAALFDSGAPPFLNAATSAEVANALQLIVTADPQVRQEMSAAHRNWFMMSHSGERWRKDYAAVLGALALGHRFSFQDSPLNAPLSTVERQYHSEQLASAPVYPHYEHAPEPRELHWRFDAVETRLSAIEGALSRIDVLLKRQQDVVQEVRFSVGPAFRLRTWAQDARNRLAKK